MKTRKRGGFTAIELVVVIVAVVLILGLLIPMLSAPKKHTGVMKESTNLRNIHAAAMIYATANKDWGPGLDAAGKYATTDFTGKHYFAKNTITDADTGSGAETGALNSHTMAVLLDEGAIVPEQMISTGETGGNTSSTPLAITNARPAPAGKTPTAGPNNGEVTTLNFSHALLQYGVPNLKNAWKADQNEQAIVMGTRVIFSEGATSPIADQFNTVWTEPGSGVFKGHYVRGDTSTTTENFKAADVSSPFGTLKYNLPTTPPSAATFTPSAHDATAVGPFGKSGATLGNFDASATKGQIGSAND